MLHKTTTCVCTTHEAVLQYVTVREPLFQCSSNNSGNYCFFFFFFLTIAQTKFSLSHVTPV